MNRLIIHVPKDDCALLEAVEINGKSYDIDSCTAITLECIPGKLPEITLRYIPATYKLEV